MGGYRVGWTKIDVGDRLPAVARTHVTHGCARGCGGDTEDRGEEELYDWIQPRRVAGGVDEDWGECWRWAGGGPERDGAQGDRADEGGTGGGGPVGPARPRRTAGAARAGWLCVG